MKILKAIDYPNFTLAVEYAIGSRRASSYEKALIKARPTELPQFYICINEEGMCGFLLLIADTMDKVRKPFTCLAIHNLETKDLQCRKELMQFAIAQCQIYNVPNLQLNFMQHLSEL